MNSRNPRFCGYAKKRDRPSVLFLVLASILGLLNSQKMKTLHANVTNAQAVATR
jgi:hypothetical protein